MASSHILISGSATPHNAQLRSHIDALQRLMNETSRLDAVFSTTVAHPDYTGFGELLGISAEDAETVYNLFVGVRNSLNAAASIPQYLSRLG